MANESFGESATFDQTAPTGAVPITQTSTIAANHEFAGNPLTAYWRGSFSGSVQGALELKWYWSVNSPTSAAITAQVTISVFADPEYAAGAERLIGRATASVVANPARTVDASPAFDATLAPRTVTTKVDCTDQNVVTAGGWHTLDDARAGDGTLCRNVGKNKTNATMALTFEGMAIDVVVAKGPRGGNFTVSIDGGAPRNVDLYRAPADPEARQLGPQGPRLRHAPCTSTPGRKDCTR